MHYYHFEDLSADLRMEHLEKSLKVISVQMSVEKNLSIINNILPTHALSGCDTVCSCSWVGKKTMFEKLKTKSIDQMCAADQESSAKKSGNSLYSILHQVLLQFGSIFHL